MTWELKEVEDIEATIDDSGVYVVINRVVTERTFKDMVGDVVRVRADLMDQRPYGDEPIISFIGSANAVRKHLICVLSWYAYQISPEHASYIGYELLRAENDPHYVQD